MTQTQLHHLIAEQVSRRAGRPALTADGTTVTYTELWMDTLELAAGLRSLGVARGDRVGIYLEKRIEAAVAPFAASAAGGVFVPINPLLRAHQVGHILADCGARVLITSGERLGLLADELDKLNSLEHVIVVGGPTEPPPGLRCPVHAWDALRADEVLNSGRIDVDVAAILYTSGSTGQPKGVVLSHRNLLAGAHSVSHYLSNHEGDRLLAVLPLSFDAGFSQVTTAFAVGAQVVLVNYLLPRDVVRLCAEHAITGLTCVPPLWNQLIECEWPERARASMRYFASTGGRMPRPTLDRLREIFPRAKPYLMYGLTEAFRSTYLDPAQVDIRPDSIGKAIPNAEILVVREDGSECDPGEVGELVHRGALVAMGYWNDPARTAERFKPAPGRQAALCSGETAVFSGDLVKHDAEGFLYFVGRKDEMIKTSGYRVSPTEIEQVAHATGLIGDAVALGVDDERVGQRIVLVASPANGRLEPEELLAELRRELPLYMVPERVVVRPALPRSPNNKLDRNLVREEVTAA
jgi:acyl-CoA ligase (AMP-forming) (exosortase A-associated)